VRPSMTIKAKTGSTGRGRSASVLGRASLSSWKIPLSSLSTPSRNVRRLSIFLCNGLRNSVKRSIMGYMTHL
jgi:hypothetical protein